MTARKNNTSPIKSIFCHESPKTTIKWPYKTINGHIRPQMILQDHFKLQKAKHGRKMRQEKIKQLFCHFQFDFHPRTFYALVQTFFFKTLSHFLLILSRF